MALPMPRFPPVTSDTFPASGPVSGCSLISISFVLMTRNLPPPGHAFCAMLILICIAEVCITGVGKAPFARTATGNSFDEQTIEGTFYFPRFATDTDHFVDGGEKPRHKIQSLL